MIRTHCTYLHDCTCSTCNTRTSMLQPMYLQYSFAIICLWFSTKWSPLRGLLKQHRHPGEWLLRSNSCPLRCPVARKQIAETGRMAYICIIASWIKLCHIYLIWFTFVNPQSKLLKMVHGAGGRSCRIVSFVFCYLPGDTSPQHLLHSQEIVLPPRLKAQKACQMEQDHQDTWRKCAAMWGKCHGPRRPVSEEVSLWKFIFPVAQSCQGLYFCLCIYKSCLYITRIFIFDLRFNSGVEVEYRIYSITWNLTVISSLCSFWFRCWMKLDQRKTLGFPQ